MLTWLFARDRDPDPDIGTILGAHPVQVIFKHSPLCIVSAFAREQVERFARSTPSMPIVVVDVIRRRPLSERIARQTGVRHESPQVLLVSNGQVRWHASHAGVTAAALSRAVATHSARIPDERGAG
jgi:bacillithiol system protein YtxJ